MNEEVKFILSLLWTRELSLCQKLVHLNLNNNKIVLLPAQRTQWSFSFYSFNYFKTKQNQSWFLFIFLDRIVGNITSLEILKLRNCPIKSIPSEIYHKGTQHVLEFLRSDKYRTIMIP